MQALQVGVVKKKKLKSWFSIMYKFGFLKKLLLFFNYMVFYRIIMPHKNKHLCGCHFLGVYSPTELLKSHIDVAPGDMV